MATYKNKEMFSARLQDVFASSGAKAIELEHHLKVTRQTVSRWRNGHNLPTDEQAAKIAKFFNVRYEWLIGRDNYKTLNDIPLNHWISKNTMEWNYLASLGYEITFGESIYDEDENGERVVVGGTWKITFEGRTIVVTDEELVCVSKELQDFVDFKMFQIFKK